MASNGIILSIYTVYSNKEGLYSKNFTRARKIGIISPIFHPVPGGVNETPIPPLFAPPTLPFFNPYLYPLPRNARKGGIAPLHVPVPSSYAVGITRSALARMNASITLIRTL